MFVRKVIRVRGETRGITYFTTSCVRLSRMGDTGSRKGGHRSMFHLKRVVSSSRVPMFADARHFSTDTHGITSKLSDLNGALDGITVLDLTRVLAGPFCTQFLGDLGAQIIKVEEPRKGDDTRAYGPPFFDDGPDGSKNSAYYVSVNRNKESIAVNLKDPEGVKLIHQLASKADVVIENFTPGVADRLGIGFDSISAVNDKIIYCSISGFGQSGGYSGRPGYDVIASSIGGLLSITGPEDGDPCRPGVPVIDQITGLYAITSILAALYRQRNLQLINILDGQFNCNKDITRADACQDVKRDTASIDKKLSSHSEYRDKGQINVREGKYSVNNECNEATLPGESCNLSMHSQRNDTNARATTSYHGGPVNIDVNLLSSQISILINIALNYLNFNLIANRRGTAHETIVPYQAFACKLDDDNSPQIKSNSTVSPDYLTVIAGNDAMFVKLINLLFENNCSMRDTLLNDPKFQSNAARQVNRKEIVTILQKQFLTKTREQWIDLLAKSGLPYGPVNKIDQVFTDECIKSQTTFTHGDTTFLKNAVTFKSTIPFERNNFIPPPNRPGQDTRSVLVKMLNLNEQRLQSLAASGVIRL